MSSLTAVLYGALIVYLGGWFLGHWTGNFSLLLFMLTVVTLVYWLAERFRFAPRVSQRSTFSRFTSVRVLMEHSFSTVSMSRRTLRQWRSPSPLAWSDRT